MTKSESVKVLCKNIAEIEDVIASGKLNAEILPEYKRIKKYLNRLMDDVLMDSNTGDAT